MAEDDGFPYPTEGRLTFDAEGQEGGPYHSRRLHVPSASSGVTVGRGYDLKMRSKTEIRDDMYAAGVDFGVAILLSQASGMAGDRAEEFIEENDLEDFEITTDTQLSLFEIAYRRLVADTRRLATKADVTRAYGATDWETLHPAIREVLVDLRFRGDYTPTCRRFLQGHVARNDLDAFAEEICDRGRWQRVPNDRFERRKTFCEAAIAARGNQTS